MKKKIILSVIVLLTAFLSAGWMLSPVVVGRSASQSQCPSGTYTYAWPGGDHSSGTDYICYSGGADVQGTIEDSMAISSSYGYSGNGGQILSNSDRLSYTLAEPTTGTIWIKADLRQIAANMDNHWYFAGFYYDGNDSLTARVRTNGLITVLYEGNATISSLQSAVALTWSAGTFETIGFSWDGSGGAGACKLSIWKDGSWSDESTTETFTAHANTPNTLQIGTTQNMAAITDDEYWIDDFAYISGTYQAANPW